MSDAEGEEDSTHPSRAQGTQGDGTDTSIGSNAEAEPDSCSQDEADHIDLCSADDETSTGKRKRRKGRGTFRIQAKLFSITYPRCNIERTVFDPLFTSKFKPAEFASAREPHEDGGYHLHVYVAFSKRTDVQSARYFDVAVDGVTYHPNVQRCKSKESWLRYISKGSDHGVGDIGGGAGYDPLSAKLGKRKSNYLDHLWSEQWKQLKSFGPVAYPIKLNCADKSYEMPAPDPRIKKRNWWIVAPPNAGKTRWLNRTFARQLIYSPRTGPYPFEGYADQDIIVYDDREGVTFAEFASVLNTWDIMQPVAGQVRYTTQNWKLGHTRSVIVLSNKTIEDSMPQEDHARMKKRFIQIVNPVLLLPGEESDDDEEEKPAAAAAAASSSNEFAAFAS